MLSSNFTLASEDLASLSEDESKTIHSRSPMPEMGKGRLERILNSHYQECLGGVENWEKVESLKLTGSLRTNSGKYSINVYQKKPSLIKVTIKNRRGMVVMGYDGDLAWNELPSSKGKVAPMEAEEARWFIHTSKFGSHLLFPFAKGKTIEYVDTVPIEGAICHQVRVILDTEFQVDYFLDIRNFLAVKVVHTNLRDDSELSVIYKDYTFDYFMPIARHTVNYEDGEFASEMKLREIKLNTGVMPWMFDIPK
ncbi:MAG: hypothetical protein ACSHYA_11225 [Opitutaceae bacterium]